jgi:hypothetical protein
MSAFVSFQALEDAEEIGLAIKPVVVDWVSECRELSGTVPVSDRGR